MKRITRLLIYLAINFLYMMPCTVWFNLSLGDPPFVPKIVLMIYVSSMVFFYIFKLTYVHIFLCIASIPLSIWKFTKDKKIVMFIPSILIAIADIIVNYFWEITGQWVVIQ